MEFVAIAIIIAVVLFAGLLIPMLFRRVVPTNEVHIVQNAKETKSFGKDTGNGNTYYKWPTWLPVIGIEVKSLPVSIFNIELDAYDAYDKGRLQFLVDVVAFFRISDYSQAAQRVSTTQELASQLTSIVQGAVRSILAKSEIEEIMEERSVFGEKFTNEVREQLKSWGVEAVKNIELMDVKDAAKSEIIHNIMAKKKSHIEMESRLEVAKNMKLAQIAEIEAKREIDLGMQEAQQQVGLRTAEAERQVEMAVESKKQAIIEQTKVTTEKEMEVVRIKSTRTAEVNKAVALVAADQKKEVALVNANQEKEVALIEANREKDVAVLDANKIKESGIIKADADLQVRTKAAEADLITKTNSAKGLELEGLARAKAKEAELMAPVNAQTTLAKEIGSNKEYQNYLITLEQIKANQAVGIAQAEAISNAEIKVIANTGTVDAGIKSVSELFTSKGGTQIGAMLEGLSNTDIGKTLVNKVIN